MFFVLFIYEIPGGHLHRHSQQFLVHVQAWCLFYSSEIKVVFVPSEGWIPRLQRGLFELSSAFANCGWNTVRDFKTAGKPHPKPSHCCSETPQQSSGRRVYCVDCWSSGSRLFHPEMLPTVAVWFLAGVHVLGALCSWTFLIKSTLWFWLCVFTCWYEDTTSCTIKPVCNNVQNQKAHAEFMSCGNKWGNDFLV